jgi:NitT/TauT family transport system substrate-binding protein
MACKAKRFISRALIFIALPLFPVGAGSQGLKQVYMSYGAVDVDQLPGWIAKETGIFRQNGLDAQLVYFTGGAQRIAALLSGDAPVTQGSGPAAITSNLRGADVVVIAGGTVTLDFWLMSRPEIKSPQQLRSGSIGISRFGGVNDSILRFLMPKLGLTIGKDVAIRQLGGLSERLAALETGQIQATILSLPANLVAQKKGFNVLADVAALGLVYQHTSVATTRRFIRENPDTVRRYVKAQIEAVHRLKTDKETGIKVLAKYLAGLKDREILETAYNRAVADARLPRKQYPSLDGIKTILEDLAESEPKAKTAKPEDFVDMRFVQELDQVGFIDKLYQK